MKKTLRERLAGNECLVFILFTVAVFWITAFLVSTPVQIWEGMVQIVASRDALITDYFELGGYGAAFFNSGLVMLTGTYVLRKEKVPFTGLSLAALFINAGFAFFGKNLLNIIPILFGTILYAKFQHAKFSRYIYTALFGTCLSPFITEMIYILPFEPWVNFLFSMGVGILIGFILPPLSMHTASMHMGYNLFNVGFSAGILAFIATCVLQSVGIQPQAVFIWKEGCPLWLTIGVYGYFLVAFLYGLFLNGWKFRSALKILRHPGRAVADFVLMDGPGATFMNMASVGLISVTYILLIGGDLSGPVWGTILTAFGFAAFGAHLKNFTPVLLGVYLSTFLNIFDPTTPAVQLAAIFGVGLAPIAGQFGVLAGIVAGALHVAIVTCTNNLYGGLNLYNNGFSCGWVAIIMVPFVESFIARFEVHPRKKIFSKKSMSEKEKKNSDT